MALLANALNYDPRYSASWPGYAPGQGESEIDPLTGAGSKFWWPDEDSKARVLGYVERQAMMNIDSHYKLFAKEAGADAPEPSDWIPVDFPGMLSRLMRHYALGPEFGVEAKVSGTDTHVQRIFTEGEVVERLRQCAEAFPSLGDAVLRIDVEEREDEEGELVPTAVPKFIHPACYHPVFDSLDNTKVEGVILAYVYKIPDDKRRDPDYPYMVLKEVHTLRAASGVDATAEPVSGTNVVRMRRKPKREAWVEYELVEWDGEKQGAPIDLDVFFEGLDPRPSGADEIPVVHMAYNAAGGCAWGRSEFERVKQIILKIENRLTQEDEILERHARPKLIVGPGVLDSEGRANLSDFDVIEIDPSILEKAVKPEYLTWDPKIDAVKHQLESLLDFFFISTETCPASFGMERSGSQVESARALRFKAHRTINKIEDLRDMLGRAIRAVFRIAQKLELAAREEDGLESYERSAININFPDPIIEDHTQDAQDYAALKVAGLVSSRRAVSDLFNLDPDETQAELDAIDEDQKTSTWLPDRVGDNPETGASADALEAGGKKPPGSPAGGRRGFPGAQPPKGADAETPKK